MLTSVALVLASFVWLCIALAFRKQHRLHAAMMAVLWLFDLLFPVYLYLTHDWYTRLVTHEELMAFGIWIHLILALSLYALYVFQMLSGRQMLQQWDEERQNHQMQARAFIILRVFVFVSGALLIESV
ncbi:MAG: hypothetical protein Q9M09_04600 [Mariprofundaceae bacterium]|nr:hypothetical protein [Mariprofundaceae bacterium]